MKAKLGDRSETIYEWWASSRCWRCGAKVERPRQSCVVCGNGHRCDADLNGCMNILLRGMTRQEAKSPAGIAALNGVEATTGMALNGR